MTFVLVGSPWTHSHPAPAVREVCAADPTLISSALYVHRQ